MVLREADTARSNPTSTTGRRMALTRRARGAAVGQPVVVGVEILVMANKGSIIGMIMVDNKLIIS